MDPGKVSATVLPGASLGPGFDATIVYVTAPPGVACDCPSDFVTRRSACGVSASVSVAALFPAAGSVTPPGALTVSVLVRLPVADASTVPVTA
jgi:hypothetical protein